MINLILITKNIKNIHAFRFHRTTHVTTQTKVKNNKPKSSIELIEVEDI